MVTRAQAERQERQCQVHAERMSGAQATPVELRPVPVEKKPEPEPSASLTSTPDLFESVVGTWQINSSRNAQIDRGYRDRINRKIGMQGGWWGPEIQSR